MEFSFSLFGLPLEQYAPLTKRGEELGFEVAWYPEHVITPVHYETRYPHNKSGRAGYATDTPLSDPWVVIGHCAALTERIRLGSRICILPLSNPFFTARAVATAQNLSGGRIIFGVGSGWLKEEFEAVGVSFDGRGSRMDEILDVLEKLWSGKPVEHHGKWFDFLPVQFGTPPQAPIPVVVGGADRRALARAALRGDGYVGLAGPVEQAGAYREEIERMREAAGRSHLPFAYYPFLYGDVNGENIRKFEDVGFEHLCVPLWSPPTDNGGMTLQVRLDGMNRAAERLDAAGYRMS